MMATTTEAEQTSGATAGAIPAFEPVALYEKALLIRQVERRLLQLFSQGKLFGTVHTCIGQEFTGVAACASLQPGDVLFSNHRCHGHFLAWTDNVDGLIAEIMGRQTGVCGGRGGSQHLHAPGFFSNGIQGGIVPVTTGIALAQKLQNTGKIAVVFIGDGTLGEGAVYESLNIASKWELPLLVILENNLYAQSTSSDQTLAGEICARATAFGIKTQKADTWDPPKLARDMARAVASVRETGQPLFFQVDTFRLLAHSKGDDDRDKKFVESYWQRDPLALFLEREPALAARIQGGIEARIDDAVAAAEKAPYTAPLPEPSKAMVPPVWQATRVENHDRCSKLIQTALRRNIRRDSRLFLLGEDIEGPYGGAFKVTGDLSLEFPGRVRNTPISEAAIAGIGNGLALSGLIPVAEIMFGDFLTLAADQWINHAAKFAYMYNDAVKAPLILRTPMGAKRGYGPTHSQSLEKHYLGLPGTQVLALHTRFDPGVIYDRLFESVDRPTLVIENKLLYALKVNDTPPEGWALEHTDEMFPTTRLRPGGSPDLTILCYGGMLPDVEAAIQRLFDEHEIVSEVICPARLYPFNPAPLLESLERSQALLVAEEGLSFAAFGAEALAQVVEASPGLLRRFGRVASPLHPIPSCGPLEKAVLPGADNVVHAALKLLA
jgi:2-oxoisovalerate dehydrogenase E1 component